MNELSSKAALSGDAASGDAPQEARLTAEAAGEVVDFERLESLAAELAQVIHDNAATWETQFDAGPGDVVSVKDAAWVIAKSLLTEVDDD